MPRNTEFKLRPLKLGVAAGLVVAIWMVLVTLASMLNLPGFVEFSDLLISFYGSYGYSVSFLGLLVGAIYGFVEAFLPVCIFALIYNKLK